MFKLFGNKNKIKKEELVFFKRIVNKLNEEYKYLLDQINEDFILEKKRNELGDEFTFRFVLNANLERKFSNSSLPQFFILRDIFVWNMTSKKYLPLELHILEGMLVGFRLEGSIDSYNSGKVDTSKVKEKHFQNEYREQLNRIMGDIPATLIEKLDVSSTFKINLPEKDLLVIKDFRDGNYLCVDFDGAIYHLIHDPYSVEKIFEGIQSFYDAWERGELNDLIDYL